jgi:hypothetical protein
MRVYIVNAIRDRNHSYLVGTYTNKAEAIAAAKREEDFRRGMYLCSVEVRYVNDCASNDDDIDLQQQVEALQAYVDVLQNYVLTLKDAMMILLDMPDIRKAMGEKVTQRLRKDLAEGRRSTFDDEMRKYIRER